MSPPPQPQPAATLILLREPNEGPLETLMIQRAATMTFGAGAWVFPGGRVDPGDAALAERLLPAGTSLDDATARIAAIRETIEEAGLAIGLDPLPDPTTLAFLRAALHAGSAFAELLDRYGLSLRLETLLPFSRWWPPEGLAKRFDTRFYIARAPAEAVVDIDGQETVALCWTTPQAMLDRPDARIMFPTACNLLRIAAHPTFAALAANVAAFPESFITTEIRQIEGNMHICIPEGNGYTSVSQPLSRAFRG